MTEFEKVKNDLKDVFKYNAKMQEIRAELADILNEHQNKMANIENEKEKYVKYYNTQKTQFVEEAHSEAESNIAQVGRLDLRRKKKIEDIKVNLKEEINSIVSKYESLIKNAIEKNEEEKRQENEQFMEKYDKCSSVLADLENINTRIEMEYMIKNVKPLRSCDELDDLIM